MTRPEVLRVFMKMDQMIRMEFTGPPDVFARRLCVSERTLFNYLYIMKELGAPITYSRPSETYVYAEPGNLRLEFTKEGD